MQTLDRVLVVGLDGATYDVLTPLAQSGVLPNLAALMARSALVQLNSTQPCITPVAWTSFATGSDPREHGILDYRFLDHRERRLRLNQAEQIRTPTLFDAIGDAGGKVVSLNLPMTWRQERSPHGIVIGGIECPSIEAALAPYPEFARRVRASEARFNLQTIWKRVPQSFDELTAGVAATKDDFQGRVTAANVADELVDWRLMVVQFQTLDALQHRCWGLLGIDDAPGAPASWVAKLQEALRTLDQCVGQLAELASRRGAALIVVSDHGFGPFEQKISLPALLESRGLLKLTGVTGRYSARLRRMGFGARKWWRRRREPGASTATLERSVAAQLPIDWRRTAAMTLHGDLAGLVYLNDPRRFGRGPVTTPRLEDQVTADVLAAFREARHPQTGEPLFTEAFSVRERFGIDPLQHHWPDCIALPAAGYHTRSKLDPAPGLMHDDPNLTGTHRQEGVLMIDAPGVPRGERLTAEMRDVAPTILAMLGIAPPASMTGQLVVPPSGGETPVYLQCSPPSEVSRETINFSEAPAFPDAAEPSAAASCSTVASPPVAAPISVSDQLAVESRLRDLGYLD